METVFSGGGSRDRQWYRQAITELGSRITMFSPSDGIAISRGTGREFKGHAYRFRNGQWIPFSEFPYSDYPMIGSQDSSSRFWTITHLTHDGAYRPVLTEFTGDTRREISLPKIMWDEIDHVMYKGMYQFRDGTAWMIGQQGHILYYDGRRWTEAQSPLIYRERSNVYDGDLNDLFMISKESGWAVGRNGIILRYRSGKWEKSASPTGSSLFRVRFADEKHGWAVGEKGTIVYWNGNEWTVVKTEWREQLNSLKVIDAHNVWAVGASSTLLRFNGTAWTKDESIALYDDSFSDIDVVRDNTGMLHFWIIGNQGIYTTSNSTGFSFTDITGQSSLRRTGVGGLFFKRSNDRIPDLLVLNEGGTNLLYENNGTNIYSDVTESSGLLEVQRAGGVMALGDVNNDGYTDLLQIFDHTNVKFSFGTMFGGFRDATAFSSLALREMDPTVLNAARFIDLDNDGFLDLYVSNYDLPDQVFHNDGTGRFTDVTHRTAINKTTGHASYGASFGDFNNDGLQDLIIPYYVSRSGRFFDLFLNTGNFHFSAMEDPLWYSAADISPTVAVTADFNNDGYCDIFVHNQKAPPYLLVNDRGKRFTNVAPNVGLTEVNFHAAPSNGVTAVADINNDGWLDIFDGSKLYLNSPEFTFTEISERVGIQFAGNPSFADIDNDGDVDIFIGSSRNALGKGDRAVLFRNNLNPKSFAKAVVHTDKSNRSAIGTRVYFRNGFTTVGVSTSPMLPQFINETTLPAGDTVIGSVRVVFPSGNEAEATVTGRHDLYESGFVTRSALFASRSVLRTIKMLEWKVELVRSGVFILLWLGLFIAGRRYGAGKFVRSRSFIGSLIFSFALLIHFFADTPVVVSFIGSFVILAAAGFISIAAARNIILKREAQYISHYKIVELIGAGGMGKVYRALDTSSKQTVALKVLNPELLKDSENRRRLSAEGHLLASFDHPNIVKVFEIGESNGRGFIAMEHLPDGTLKEKLEKEQILPLLQIKEYILQVCDGLSEVHARGVVHRDLKTGNLMLGTDGKVRIMDFGLSKSPLVTTMTSLGTVLGTLGYVAPEQVTGSDVDRRTDIFSFGVVMYELCTNQLPFRGENEIALIHSIFNTVPPFPSQLRSDIPGEWNTVVMRCLSKDLSDRYQTVEEIRDAMEKTMI